MADLFNFILRLLAGCIPSQAELANPIVFYNWQKRIGWSLMGAYALSGMIALLSLGVFPSLYAGFARGDDIKAFSAQYTAKVSEVAQRLKTKEESDDRYRAQQLVGQIIDTQEKYCRARNSDLRQQLLNNINEQLSLYRQLAGHPLEHLPACGELL